MSAQIILIFIVSSLVIWAALVWTDIMVDGVSIQEVFYLVSVVVGGIFGPYYFFSRIQVEEKRDKEERRRNRVNQIIKYYDSFDELVRKLLCFDINNESELLALRLAIENSYSTMQKSLERNRICLEITNYQLKGLLGVISFVDKNLLIKQEKNPKLSTDSFIELVPEYQNLFRGAHDILSLKQFEMDEN